jgi:Xaa-Pro aminopeptidase
MLHACMDALLGYRYASYCANIARTYFVDPSPQQTEEYSAIQEAHAAAIAAITEGAPLSAAYQAVVQTLQVCPTTLHAGPGLHQ